MYLERIILQCYHNLIITNVKALQYRAFLFLTQTKTCEGIQLIIVMHTTVIWNFTLKWLHQFGKSRTLFLNTLLSLYGKGFHLNHEEI